MLAITVLALAAGLIHILFFVLESLLWLHPVVRKIFGQSEAEAKTTRLLAFNQGFYNLFLALSAIAGVWLMYNVEIPIAVSVALLTVSLGSMVGAAIVLVISAGKKMLRGALLQGLIPLACLILLWRPL